MHPGALKQGGKALVACCITAAQQASVSGITVFELDITPGTNKKCKILHHAGISFCLIVLNNFGTKT